MEEMDSSDEEVPEFDWSYIFKQGFCPKDLVAKVDLEPNKLSGDWYLHRSNDYKYAAMPTSCFHSKVKVNDDGTFLSKEEANFMGKTWVAEKITGEIKKDTVRTDYFDEKLSVKMQVLDTDYDKYLITVSCLDNMSFALETELEPVHSIVVSVFTHDPEEDLELIKSLEKKVSEKIPNFNLIEFITIP